MHNFEVWAPYAKSVALAVNGELIEMTPGERGHWHICVGNTGPGDHYAFLLNGDPTLLPDPRSQWQPNGVHGASRIVDHETFRWTDQLWHPPPLDSGILYEMHVGTFTPEGTFESAIERLDYLHELGITHLEIMPVNEFSGERGWGYDGVQPFAPHHSYGGPDGLKQLVNACHEKGLAVLLDVVYNHLGPVGNYLERFGPYFTETYHTPWGAAVNLDGPDSTEVRRFFCDNGLYWLREYHFDGLRLDAVHAFIDRSALHFLEQFASEVDAFGTALGKHLVVIAESELNQPLLVVSREANGYGLNAQWSDDFHHALHTVLTGETDGYYQDFGSLAQIAKALRSVYVYTGEYSAYRRRHHGRPVIGLPGSRFAGYLQNHDQIGNRARGDRISHLVSTDRAKIGSALVLLSPFVPMLFQGEEFGASSPFLYFTDHDDPEVGKAVTEGRKREFAAFGWNPEDIPNPQGKEAFESSKLRWEELREEPHRSLFQWHCELIALRRAHPELTSGCLSEVEVDFSESEQWLSMRRSNVSVCCNLSRSLKTLKIPPKSEIVLKSNEGVSLASSDRIVVPPDSVAVLLSRDHQASS
jgi:maltooligosyltrehalose trehalohydrolase